MPKQELNALLDDIQNINPRELLQEFIEEEDQKRKLFLKSLYDLLLQTRQREIISRETFVR